MQKEYSNSNTCCVFGHRKINLTEELKESLRETLETLILQQDVSTFLFGSRSEFDALCLAVVTELKTQYPHIRRVYVRAEYPVINEEYRQYLLRYYDDTYYPEGIRCAGRAVYVERNQEMIDDSAYCVVYYDADYSPNSSKSGTAIAYRYALTRKRTIYNLYPHEKSIPPN